MEVLIRSKTSQIENQIGKFLIKGNMGLIININLSVLMIIYVRDAMGIDRKLKKGDYMTLTISIWCMSRIENSTGSSRERIGTRERKSNLTRDG